MECKYCKSLNLILEPRIKGQDVLTADMVALKCADCGKWLKWCPKNERLNYIKNKLTKEQQAVKEFADEIKLFVLENVDCLNSKVIIYLDEVKDEIKYLLKERGI